MAHSRSWKTENLKVLADSLRTSKVVGVVSIRGLPAAQFQQIRKKLSGVAQIHVSRVLIMGAGSEPGCIGFGIFPLGPRTTPIFLPIVAISGASAMK